MMEALQIGPAAFGPMASGTADGHRNTAGRGIRGLQGIFSQTGSVDLTAREGAQNTLTDIAEFKMGDIFMTFNYQNKGGRLFANGRPIENINNTDEIGGDRMGRVMNALNQMITDKNIEESIVASEDLGYGRHFIYRYRRGEGDTIEGLAFEYQGSAEELSEVVHQLGRRAINSKENRDHSIDFVQPLCFSEENKNSVEDLASIAHKSFRTEERKQEMKSYLARLDRDTTQFDQLMKRRQMQEEELAKQFKEIIWGNEDAKVGIAAAVYGSISIAEKMALAEGRRREEKISASSEFKQSIYPQGNKDILSFLSYGMMAIPGLIDHTGRLIDQRNKTRIELVKNQMLRNHRAESIEVKEKVYDTEQIIESIIPGLSGIVNLIIPIYDDGLDKDQLVSDLRTAVRINKSDNLDIGEDNTEFNEQLFWRELISVIFKPLDKDKNTDGEIFFASQIESDRTEEERPFLLDERSFYDALVKLIPILHVDKIQESSHTQNSEELILLTTNLQQGLEVIAKFMGQETDAEFDNGLKGEEKTRQKLVEDDVVKLGEEVLGAILSRENIFVRFKDKELKPQIEALAQLSFLLHVYHDQNSSNELKHLLSALIYMQIKEMGKDRAFIDKTPQLSLLFQQFSELSPKSDFLGVRFFVMIETIEKLTKIKLLKTTDGQVDINTLLKKVNVLIYLLSMRQNGVGFSPELLTKGSFLNNLCSYLGLRPFVAHPKIHLCTSYFGVRPNSQILKSKFILPNKKKNKKSPKQFSPGGIIYQYQYAIAYKAIFMPE